MKDVEGSAQQVAHVVADLGAAVRDGRDALRLRDGDPAYGPQAKLEKAHESVVRALRLLDEYVAERRQLERGRGE